MIDDFEKSGIRNIKSVEKIVREKINEIETAEEIAQKKIEEIKAILGTDHPLFMMNMDEDPPRNLTILEAEIDKSPDAEKLITTQRFIEYFDALIIKDSPSKEEQVAIDYIMDKLLKKVNLG